MVSSAIKKKKAGCAGHLNSAIEIIAIGKTYTYQSTGEQSTERSCRGIVGKKPVI